MQWHLRNVSVKIGSTVAYRLIFSNTPSRAQPQRISMTWSQSDALINVVLVGIRSRPQPQMGSFRAQEID